MDREVGADRGLCQLGGVDVDDHEVRCACEGPDLVADLAYVQAAAQDKQEVRVLDSEVAGTIADAARSADEQRVILPHNVQRSPGGRDWYPQRLNERPEVIDRARAPQCRAGQDDGPLRCA